MRLLAAVAVLVLLAGCRPLIPLGDLLAASPPPEGAPLVQFSSAIVPVTEVELAGSWRPGCPVGVEDLRLVSVTYRGFDDHPHQGELVVHADSAEAIVSVMEELFLLQFPIERMERVDAYRGDDDASMAANNTSAFNCREVSRRPGVWSQHAFGTAIDINPVQNPYILRNGTVLPPGAVTDRASAATGLITADGGVVEAFADIGWGWGGSWSGVLDYQHFSASGR
ncbi:MAG: M15 family metallopeptidase [Acidimicrobiia bacterium]|nr:M15 family metallopeptidase [Acidimicrobiia bacterium]